MRTINVVNQSTVVAQDEFLAVVAAAQKQYNEHVVPAYGTEPVTLVTLTASPTIAVSLTAEAMFVVDDSDQANALGYHELANGVPKGFVFAKTSIDAGDPWSTTFTHELIEQCIDRYCDLCVVTTMRGRPVVVAVEPADPVEQDSYDVDGVKVSNFVLPAWFQGEGQVTGPFDYMGTLKAPLTCSPGGYFQYEGVRNHWMQVGGRVTEGKKYLRIGRRVR